MDSYLLLAVTAAAFLLAGFVKGVIGLGLPTVAIGLLGIVMSPAQAAAILVVPSLVTNIWQLVSRRRRAAADAAAVADAARRLHRHLHRRGCCCRTMTSARRRLARRGAGALCRARPGRKSTSRCRGTPKPGSASSIGFLTGAATVATGVFVIPGVPYITALDFERDRWCRRSASHSRCRPSRWRWRWPIRASFTTLGRLAGAGCARRRADRDVARADWCAARCRPETFRLFFFLGLLLLGGHLALRGLL